MQSLITEIERVRQHGFTATEMERAEQELLKWYESHYNERDNTESKTYAEDFETHFLEGEAIPSIELLYETVKSLIPDISIDEVNEAASLIGSQRQPGHLSDGTGEGRCAASQRRRASRSRGVSGITGARPLR